MLFLMPHHINAITPKRPSRLLANRLADLPVAPVAALKQLLRQGMDLDLPQALELESRVTARLST